MASEAYMSRSRGKTGAVGRYYDTIVVGVSEYWGTGS